jgi:hypothetical protein
MRAAPNGFSRRINCHYAFPVVEPQVIPGGFSENGCGAKKIVKTLSIIVLFFVYV